MMETKITHASTMGAAPYRFIALVSFPSKAILEANPESYNLQMGYCVSMGAKGVCDHCGNIISNHYIVEDAEGKRFAVGSECIHKVNGINTQVVTEAHKAKLKADRAKRQERKEMKLEAERKANGGLTDAEVRQQKNRERYQAQVKAQQERDAEGLIAGVKYLTYVDRLMRHTNSGFAMGVADGLRYGTLPKGRGMDIMLDILAKDAGRKGSKPYADEYSALCEFFEQGEK